MCHRARGSATRVATLPAREVLARCVHLDYLELHAAVPAATRRVQWPASNASTATCLYRLWQVSFHTLPAFAPAAVASCTDDSSTHLSGGAARRSGDSPRGVSSACAICRLLLRESACARGGGPRGMLLPRAHSRTQKVCHVGTECVACNVLRCTSSIFIYTAGKPQGKADCTAGTRRVPARSMLCGKRRCSHARSCCALLAPP